MGRSGSAEPVASMWLMGGCSVYGCWNCGLIPEWRLGGCPACLGISNLGAGSDGTLVADEAMAEKKNWNFEAGVRGRSDMLTLLLLGAAGRPEVQGASSMVAEKGTGVQGLSGMVALPSISRPGGRGGNHSRGGGPICCVGLYDDPGALW